MPFGKFYRASEKRFRSSSFFLLLEYTGSLATGVACWRRDLLISDLKSGRAKNRRRQIYATRVAFLMSRIRTRRHSCMSLRKSRLSRNASYVTVNYEMKRLLKKPWLAIAAVGLHFGNSRNSFSNIHTGNRRLTLVLHCLMLDYRGFRLKGRFAQNHENGLELTIFQ